MDFWTRLEQVVLANHMNFADLSRAIGISQASINGWKNGSYPRADKACKIASVLRTTVEYLVTGEEASPAPRIPPGLLPTVQKLIALDQPQQQSAAAMIDFLAAQSETDAAEKNQTG